MFTRIIVHKIKIIFTFTLFTAIFLLHGRRVFATQVRNLMLDPASPVYNQPFKCAITLDQDDHRNACSLMPQNAPAGAFPMDVCTIDNVSNDKLTRFYNCIANGAKKVPGPGNYKIVDWNFTGDGETGQVIYSRSITIVAEPPPVPTSVPKPTALPTAVIQPTDVVVEDTPLPSSPPTSSPSRPPSISRIPTIVEFSITNNEEMSPTPIPAPSFFTQLKKIKFPKLPGGSLIFLQNNISAVYVKTTNISHGAIDFFSSLIRNFTNEANY